MSKLCVTIEAPTMAMLRAARDAVTDADADLIELRLDSVTDPDVAGALEGRQRPVIITCRPEWEGGAFMGSEEERLGLLREASRLGAEYVDVEWRAAHGDLVASNGGRGIVLSDHDFVGIPHDLVDRDRAMRATGAEVVKLAARVERLRDLVPLLDLAKTPAGSGRVILGLGWTGVATRILAARFGSCWTYAGALETLGQLSAESMQHEYHFTSLTATTDVYGLVGSRLIHSAAPAMHNAAFRALGVDAVCVPFESADGDEVFEVARAIGVRGLSETRQTDGGLEIMVVQAERQFALWTGQSAPAGVMYEAAAAWLDRARVPAVRGVVGPTRGVPG